MNTEVNPFSVSWKRKMISPHIHRGVLEFFLVYALFSSKLVHGTLSLCFITQLIYENFGYFILFPFLCQKNVLLGL